MEFKIRIFLTFLLASSLVHASVISLDSNQGSTVGNSGVDPSQMGNKFGLKMNFDDFKKQFGKSYSSASEEINRRKNFEINLENLAKADCWPCGVTHMYDKSQEEMKKLNGLIPGNPDLSNSNLNIQKIPEPTLSSDIPIVGAPSRTPSSWDWRSYGVVTSVKDQGSCGSCWAFSATAFLESEGIRRNQWTKAIDLSEHYLLQCDTLSLKCNGGYFFTAAALGATYGMPLETTYPYNPGYDYTPDICPIPTVSALFPNSGKVVYYSSTTTKTSDSQLITELLKRPIMIGVNANDLFSYSPPLSGTISQKTLTCAAANSNGSGINHAMFLVGYTSGAWLVKNTWGPQWGDNGYVWITRNATRGCSVGYYWSTFNSTI